MKHQAAVLLVFTLVACSTPEETKITDATKAPLNDLNLIHVNIPPVLVDAKKQPYAVPADQNCNELATEIHTLDEALGPDLDVPPPEDKSSLIQKGASTVGDAAVDAVKGAAEGVVPFRSWLRKLTGAERQSKEVASAIAAGTVRRAFLKGLRSAHSCS